MSDDDGIFKVQTVPPPPGETDAYSAPTKVGAMAASIVEEVVLHAKRQAESAAMRAKVRTATEDGKVVGALRIPRPTQSPIITTLSTPLPVPIPSEDTDLDGEPEPVGAVDSSLQQAKPTPNIGTFDEEIVLEAFVVQADSAAAERSLDTAVGDAGDAIAEDGAAPASSTFEQVPNGPAPRATSSVRRSYVPVLLFALSALSFALYWLRRH